jgi:UDP-N-acetylmuramate: L-alanyl-gamma-D-glutamyl-meso-diaminopimelate ligase
MGCWTPREGFARAGGPEALWSARLLAEDGSRFEVREAGRPAGTVEWPLIGGHNVDNALAAIAAARHAGVAVATSIEALARFAGIKRRMELRGEVRGIRVYDDFAHHPTAIETTLAGLRGHVGRARIIAVLEPRSNTMRLGVHRESLGPSLAAADEVWLYAPPDLGWDAGELVRELGPRAHLSAQVDELVASLRARLRPGDHVLIMSNGSFGGIHGKLLAALAPTPPEGH